MRQPRVGKWAVIGSWLLLVAGLAAGFGHNFGEMWIRWFPAWSNTRQGLYDSIVGGEGYYTHGPLIPAVSLLIFLLLVRHTKVPVRPSRRLGGVVLGLSVFLHLVSSLARVNFASGFAFVGVVAGVVLILWGRGALRRLWFPIVLLLFMVPLPEVSIAQLNFRLKMFAAGGGVAVASGLGMAVERVGNRVLLEGGKDLVIANICNGLRTLISLLAFGALYAYVCRLRGWWRAVLFAMTIPVAVFSNSLRILSLIAVADVWDVKTATGWWHDTSGVLIFFVAFLLMFGLERLILWARKAAGRPAEVVPLFHDVRRGPEDRGQWSRMLRAAGGPRGWVVGGALVLTAGAAGWLNQSVPPALTPELVQQAVPARLTVLGRGVRALKGTLDQRTLTVLEHPSYLYHRYVSEDGSAGGDPGPVEFCLIFSSDNRKGTHPPDLCLEGGEQDIIHKDDLLLRDLELTGPGGGGRRRIDVPCRELVVQSGRTRTYFVYTYKCGQAYTRSFWRQQFVILVNGLLHRNPSGALIRLSTPMEGGLPKARDRCLATLREALPHVDRNLP